MSGGVGLVNDMSLPKELGSTTNQSSLTPPPPPQQQPRYSPQRWRFLTFRQLNALVIILVFSASGMVSLSDIILVIFSIIYILILSKFSFPLLSTSPDPPVFSTPNRLLSVYVFVAAIIGLFLPVAYISDGIIEGDREGIKAAAPHVFLLASQVFMEGLTFNVKRFSIPVRVFVPVFYNTRRLFTIGEWLETEMGKVGGEFSGSERRVIVGRGLALANMAFWYFNLFGFLLPVYLPKAFKRYYAKLTKD